MEKSTKKSNHKTKTITKPAKEDLKVITALNSQIKTLKEQVDKLNLEKEQMTQQYVLNIQQKAAVANQLLEEKIHELKTLENTKIEQIKKYAFEPAALNLIEITNQLAAALNFVPPDEKSKKYQAGFKMFLVMLKNLLHEQSVSEILVNIGDEFNSDIMECLELVDTPDYQDNQVVQVINPGYQLHQRVLKPALVKVAKRKN